MDKIDFFKNLDFTEYESKILNSLLILNNASPKQLSAHSTVPQNKLYNILKKFINLGITALIPGEPHKYKLVNLQTYIEDKIKEKENLLSIIKKDSKKIKEPVDSEEFSFSLIKSQRAIMNKLAENNPKVKKEIFGVQGSWKLWAKGLREMQNTIKKGVKVRAIGIIDKETKKRALEWKKVGCNIRIWNKKFGDYPLRFTVFDGKWARITFGKPEIADSKDYITFWTNSKSLIQMLKREFEVLWKECKVF